MPKAVGIPSRENYGNTSNIPVNQLLTYIDQLHEARRAGKHHDIRFGDKELFSWATRKGLPEPGQKRMLFQQPIHSKEYADFEGEIPEGYGAGVVSKSDKGTVLVTEATDNKIKFVLAHKKYPEYYTMIRQEGENKPWLMINHTPTSPEQVLGNKDLFSKVHIKSVPAEKAEEFLNGVVEGKVDGASGLFKLKKDSIDVLSYRIGTNGRPIVHTERFFGGKAPTVDVPKKWQNKVLRGEIYGVDKDDQPLSSQEVTPLLNMSLAKSIQNQQDTKTKLRGALFGVAGEDLNTPTRESELKEVLSFLPPQYFDRPPVAHGPEEGMKLWREVEEGKHPEISEGVVVYPESGDAPLKIKLRPEYDVQVSGVFPGQGKYTGSAGGIEYKVPDGVGRVGTGFDDDFRKWLWENKDSLGGRIARITSTKKLPSGKYFQPSFMGLHEDYPTKKAEDDIGTSFLPDYTPDQLREMGVYKEVYGPADAPRLASLPQWPAHWYNEADPHGWLQWYDRYSRGRRIDDDKRQIKRWLAFKARHGGKAFRENPTPRRAYALRNWGIDASKLVDDPESLKTVMDEYKQKQYSKKMEKISFLPKIAKDKPKDNVSSIDPTDYDAHDAYLMSGKKMPGSAMPFKNYFSKNNLIESLPWDTEGGLGAALRERGFQNLRDTMDGNIIMTDKDGNLYTWNHELGGITRGHYNLITDRDMDWYEEYKDMNKVSFLPKSARKIAIDGNNSQANTFLPESLSVMTPRSRASADSFYGVMDNINNKKYDPIKGLNTYIQGGSGLMGEKLFNKSISPADVVKLVRKSGLASLAGGDWSLMEWGPKQQSHYDGFSAGPLSAYSTFLKEKNFEDPSGNNSWRDTPQKLTIGLKDQMAPGFAVSKMTGRAPYSYNTKIRDIASKGWQDGETIYKDPVKREMVTDDSINKIWQTATSLGRPFDPSKAMTELDLAVSNYAGTKDLSSIPAKGQANMFSRFNNHLKWRNPDLYNEKQIIDFDNGIIRVPDAITSYKPLIDTMTGLDRKTGPAYQAVKNIFKPPTPSNNTFARL